MAPDLPPLPRPCPNPEGHTQQQAARGEGGGRRDAGQRQPCACPQPRPPRLGRLQESSLLITTLDRLE